MAYLLSAVKKSSSRNILLVIWNLVSRGKYCDTQFLQRLSPPSTSPGKKTYSALDTSNARVVTETKETVEGQKYTLDYYTMETGISLRRVVHFLAFGTF